jgi:hypothetical protein
MDDREILEQHRRAPSAAVFMARACLPSPGLPAGGNFPSIVQRWMGLRIDAQHLAAFHGTTGLDGKDGVSVLYPHVLGFRLLMALVTHPTFPFPIWKALQIRNHLVRHRLIDSRELLDFETRTGAHRVVAKGIEVDVETRLAQGSEYCWESTVTFFYRGHFGAAQVDAVLAPSPDLAQASVAQRFEIPRGGGLRFGKLTGDYNGIHNWNWYARLLGFRAAFPHPQRVAGMCMARLQGPDSVVQHLDLWIKGPVYYGARLVLSAESLDHGIQFGLSLDGDHRAAILGRWRGE